MTGEITLTGRLLPIGGVKEKVLAAHRYKMTHVLLPRRNEKDLEEIPAEVHQAMGFEFADSVLDALAILFPGRSFAVKPDLPLPPVSPTPPAVAADTADLPLDQPAH
jgi:ATP-dependent Lon protease